jgi:hypothetical protein
LKVVAFNIDAPINALGEAKKALNKGAAIEAANDGGE